MLVVERATVAIASSSSDLSFKAAGGEMAIYLNIITE